MCWCVNAGKRTVNSATVCPQALLLLHIPKQPHSEEDSRGALQTRDPGSVGLEPAPHGWRLTLC